MTDTTPQLASLIRLGKVLEKHEGFEDLIESEHIYNPWFTPDSVRQALSGVALLLQEENLRKWLEAYSFDREENDPEFTVGILMAGNIPLVGFHDLLCVMVSGHRALVKCSSKDDRLIRRLVEILGNLDEKMGNRIRFTDDRLQGMDAVIATGSNNSARYFEYYFRNIPHIIRKNRNGLAVLDGKESEEELEALGRDIFSYFGLGCRNVSKILVPEDYQLPDLLRVLDRFQELGQHHKYGNNVDYQRTIFLMNQVDFLDNGILLLKEDPKLASPVGVVYYERYSELAQVEAWLEGQKEEIQCVVSRIPGLSGTIAPGSSQSPLPWDYADGVDTLNFLKQLQ